MTANFVYDAFARRRSKTVSGVTTNFLYDGMSLVQELSGGSPTANLLGGTGIDEILTRTDAAAATSLFADALGSTVALTDASGTVQTSYTYEPFGQSTVTGATTSSSISFMGREEDGTGLEAFRARYYDPRKQRFLSEDPIGFDAGDANLYAYVGNQPTQVTDPTGEIRVSAPPGSPLYNCFFPPTGGRKDPWWGPIARFVCQSTIVPIPDLIPAEPGFRPVGGPGRRGPMGPGHPNWRPPTNPPQMPPAPESLPEGWRIRTGGPEPGYPDDYWKLEKPQPSGRPQPIDPSTMKPGSRPETHVPSRRAISLEVRANVHGLPRDFDPKIFLGRTVEQVCFSSNQVEISFDDQLSLVILGEFSLLRDDNILSSSGDAAVRSLSPTARNELARLAGATVKKASGTTDGTLSIEYESGDALQLFDAEPMYEAYIISHHGKVLIV